MCCKDRPFPYCPPFLWRTVSEHHVDRSVRYAANPHHAGGNPLLNARRGCAGGSELISAVLISGCVHLSLHTEFPPVLHHWREGRGSERAPQSHGGGEKNHQPYRGTRAQGFFFFRFMNGDIVRAGRKLADSLTWMWLAREAFACSAWSRSCCSPRW